MISFDNLPALFLHLRKPHIDDAERYSHLTGYFESDTESESESDEFARSETTLSDDGNDFEYLQAANQKPSEERKLHGCTTCEFKAHSLGTLSRHRQTWHENAKLACPECDIKFAQQWQVAFHLENQHQKSSEYHCTKCDENHKYFKVYRDGRCFPYHKK